MPPRFVELATPVEDGVQWASFVLHKVPATLLGWFPENATTRAVEALAQAVEALVEHVPEGLHALAKASCSFVATLPQPRGAALYAMVGGATATLLWQGVVRIRALRILATHGHVGRFRKDQ
tara:strand:- start:470 stop:835 length:366 start_codon:yes stop_codon:yes gene_type:complete